MLDRESETRIGVYVCHCGLNIASTVDVRGVAEYAQVLPHVVVARDYMFMCSASGQELIKTDIKHHKLNRVVIAACSPSLHELTFKRVAAEAGLNPYLVEIANIREQCSWVHSDRGRATEKAKDLVRMAVARVALLEPLNDIVVEAQPSVLILGGGVAGLKAALDLAQAGFRVYLVEKLPTLGGNVARLGRLAHANMRGIDVVRTLMSGVVSNPNVTIFVNSELADLSGFAGNFRAKLKLRPRFVSEKCTLCSECAKVCPVEVSNEYEFGLTKRKAIYLPFKGAYPTAYVVDQRACTKCGKCVKICKQNAINLEDKERELEISAGAIIIATGFRPYEPPEGEYGYGRSSRVLTLPQLERLLDESELPGGELRIGGSAPRSIAFILCVGSLGTTKAASLYCSRVCCAATLKNALIVKRRDPEVDVYVLYRDIVTYGRGDERLYEEASERLVKFVKFIEPPKVHIGLTGEIEVEVYDATLREVLLLSVDAIVLAVGMRPSEDLKRICAMMKLPLDQDGFLREAHLKLRPVESPVDGIFLVGSVVGPKNISESVMSGGAAACKAVSLLARGRLTIEPIVAYVHENRCIKCGLCEDLCHFGAISVREGIARVETTMCKGCGVCVASCPTGALTVKHFTDSQIVAQIREGCV